MKIKLKTKESKWSRRDLDYSKELFLRVNKLLFDCQDVKFSNKFVVCYDCTFRTKHSDRIITLWMHEEQMNICYYFKHY